MWGTAVLVVLVLVVALVEFQALRSGICDSGKTRGPRTRVPWALLVLSLAVVGTAIVEDGVLNGKAKAKHGVAVRQYLKTYTYIFL